MLFVKCTSYRSCLVCVLCRVMCVFSSCYVSEVNCSLCVLCFVLGAMCEVCPLTGCVLCCVCRITVCVVLHAKCVAYYL